MLFHSFNHNNGSVYSVFSKDKYWLYLCKNILFQFFFIIPKNFAFFFRKFNLGEWLLRTFAEVITQFIHATTRTLISVHCQLLQQVQKLDSTILEKFHFSTFNYNEKPMSYPLLQLLRDLKFYSWKHIFLKFVF